VQALGRFEKAAVRDDGEKGAGLIDVHGVFAYIESGDIR
jgi:hypothetical protein